MSLIFPNAIFFPQYPRFFFPRNVPLSTRPNLAHDFFASHTRNRKHFISIDIQRPNGIFNRSYTHSGQGVLAFVFLHFFYLTQTAILLFFLSFLSLSLSFFFGHTTLKVFFCDHTEARRFLLLYTSLSLSWMDKEGLNTLQWDRRWKRMAANDRIRNLEKGKEGRNIPITAHESALDRWQ